ncbi:unnamed protein product [Albugo candida]|uniref:Uncharacterized protein n=1 Tax=Albugo candida TaxID=65357 RepID=A0A024FSV8_9STRA|nr:unnamed protein product [Albugo candida]|eukprot:CCI10118.1 unnamed protein product [Albugo candida]
MLHWLYRMVYERLCNHFIFPVLPLRFPYIDNRTVLAGFPVAIRSLNYNSNHLKIVSPLHHYFYPKASLSTSASIRASFSIIHTIEKPYPCLQRPTHAHLSHFNSYWNERVRSSKILTISVIASIHSGCYQTIDAACNKSYFSQFSKWVVDHYLIQLRLCCESPALLL